MNASPLRVVVLMGGPSREREVSLSSGASVAAALARRGHHVLPVRIETDRRWVLPAGAVGDLPGPAGAGSTGEGESASLALPPAPAVAQLQRGTGDRDSGFDVAFVALHGAFGEDGTVQGFLETLGIPYTGSGVAASAFAMDKERAKEILSRHGVRTAAWTDIDRAAWTAGPAAALDRVVAATGLPAVVKMPCEGSSFGVTIVATRAELESAVVACMEDREGRALVESKITGVEVTCPVLGNRGGALRTLPLVEIVPKGREFFDFTAKYEGASDEICPACVSEAVAEKVRAAALTAHRVFGCDGVSRSDFIVPADGEPVYLETNTVPGMTPASLVPLAASRSGMSYEQLCETLVELALARHR